MTSPAPVTNETSQSSNLSRLIHDTISIYTWGFRISLALVLCGLLVGLIRNEPLAEALGSPGHVFDRLVNGHADGFLGIGILAMILTPLIGAASIAINFFRIDDRRFGMFTVAIVIILIASVATSYI